MSGNSCKAEVKYIGRNSLSPVMPSVPKKSRQNDVNSPKSKSIDETSDSRDSKVSCVGTSETREEIISRSGLRKVDRTRETRKPEVKNKISTTRVKETVLVRKSSSKTANKRLMETGKLCQHCSVDEQSISKRLKRVGVPAVHIQRLDRTAPALFKLSTKCDHGDVSADGKTTKSMTKDLAECQGDSCRVGARRRCQMSVKQEPESDESFHSTDNQKQVSIKQENDCDDDSTFRGTAHAAGRGSEKAVVPLLTKFDEELKSSKQSSSGPVSLLVDAVVKKEPTDSMQPDAKVNNSAAGENSHKNDVVAVDGSITKTARKSKGGGFRKRRAGTDVIRACGVPVKQESCPAADENFAVAGANTRDSSGVCEQPFISHDALARTSKKNVGTKSAAKKTRPTTTHKQSTPAASCGLSSSMLTRSMIKIPGYMQCMVYIV